MKSKVAGYVFIIGSLYYIIAEAISATFFNASIFNTYIFHTISELGIPNGKFSIVLADEFRFYLYWFNSDIWRLLQV